MAAFKCAVEAGCDGIELDVHRCAQESSWSFTMSSLPHHQWSGLVSDATLPELKRLSAGAWYDKEFSGEKLPTLEEVLQFVDGRAIVNV